ncbi:lasso RiPP family leader peptide-containing protein [Streptomyces sp. NPDC001262]
MKNNKKAVSARYTVPALTKVGSFGKDTKGASQRGKIDTTASGYRMV